MRPVHQLCRFALPIGIHQHRDLRRIPIVHIVRDHLEMPLQLACIRIEGDRRIGIEIVTLADIAVPVGRRIASAPDDHVLFGVECARHPGGSAAALPGIGKPGVTAELLF